MTEYKPWFNQMCDGEHDTKNHTDASHHNIGNTQEGILATNNGPG